MASVVQQQTWVPYETTRDCSQGFCSIYCPQWCYIIFPPPPPPLGGGFSGGGFAGDDPTGDASSSASPAFSPLMIAIIGVLAGALLLVAYYTVVSKFCGNLDSLRRRRRSGTGAGEGDDSGVHRGGGDFRHDTWYVPAGSGGVEESVIKSITVCKYKRGEGLIEGTDCSVCLSEFREDESLRLLPKCSHAFHVSCIDKWLKSHANCPLCRASIVSHSIAVPPPPPPIRLAAPPPPPPDPPEIRPNGEIAAAATVEDLERGRPEEKAAAAAASSAGNGGGVVASEERRRIEIQPIRRSFSMDACCRSRILVADRVFGIGGGEDGTSAAMTAGVGSSAGGFGGEEENGKGGGGGGGGGGSRGRVAPPPMKRSFSSGRFCSLARQEKAITAPILPI